MYRDQSFLEFHCGHFGIKMESLRPSYQRLGFCPYLGMVMGVAQNLLDQFHMFIEVSRVILDIMGHMMVKK